jgi:hypothetical protein
MTTSKAYRSAILDKDSPPDLGVVLAIRRRAIGRLNFFHSCFYTNPRLRTRVLPARSAMLTTLIAQMSDLLAPISKSTTRAYSTYTNGSVRGIPNRELVKSVNKHVIRRAQRYAWGTDKTELSFVAKHLSQEAHLDIDFFRTARAQLASGERPTSNARAPVKRDQPHCQRGPHPTSPSRPPPFLA